MCVRTTPIVLSLLALACAPDSVVAPIESAPAPEAGSPETPATPPASPTTPVTPAPVESVELHGVVRLTPEQASNRIFGATGYRLAYDDEEAPRPYDIVVDEMGVALGGIDFRVASIRDPRTRVSTLLTVRSVAWLAAGWVVFSEWDTEADARRLFTECDFLEDTPDGPGAARFDAQVTEIFWRFYSRAPAADELAAVRSAFLVSLSAEGDPPRAWQTVLYALLSTLEFWTT